MAIRWRRIIVCTYTFEEIKHQKLVDFYGSTINKKAIKCELYP